jgi:acyl-CoA-binding protein
MEKLFLYGLYKQATEGNVPTASSMMLWNPVARAKHQAWSKFKDTSRDQAKMMYVHAFATMIGDHSSTATAPTGAAATLREQSTYDAMEDMEDDMDVFGNGMGVRPSMPTGEEDDSDSDSDSEKDDDDRSQPLHHHPLHSVARRGDAEQLRQLLASSQGSSDHNNSHIDECDKSGQTALHLAADQGNDECVQLLLQAGANPNAADLDGITVLQTAVIADHVSTAALLLQAGANADQTDADGETPRSCANEGSTPEMKLLFATYITD